MSYEYLFFYIYKSVNHSNLFTDISFWRWKCKRWWRHAGIHINIYEWHTNEWFIVTSYWFSNANYTLNWWFSRLDSIFFFGRGEVLASISICNLCTKYSMMIGLCVDEHLLVDGRWQFAKLTLPYLSILFAWKQKHVTITQILSLHRCGQWK